MQLEMKVAEQKMLLEQRFNYIREIEEDRNKLFHASCDKKSKPHSYGTKLEGE